MTHELKILPSYYERVMSGVKTFELRKYDRDFQIGDKLVLKEWDGHVFTGRRLERFVGYIYYGCGDYGLESGYCILGLKQEEL